MLKKIPLLVLLSICSITLFANDKSTIQDSLISVKAHLKAKMLLRLTYLDEFFEQQVLVFRNNSDSNAVLTEKIISKKAIELKYDLTFSDGAKKKDYYHRLFLNPGDDIALVMHEDYDITCLGKDNKAVFADKELELYNIFDAKWDMVSKLKDVSIEKYDQRINNIYIRNLNKIDSLYNSGKIDLPTSKLWKTAVETDYYNQLLNPLFLNAGPNVKSTFEKKVRLVGEQLPILEHINSKSLKSVLRELIRYEVILQGGSVDDIEFYTNYLARSNWSENIVTGLLIERFNAYPEKSSKVFRRAFNKFKDYLSNHPQLYDVSELSARYFPKTTNFNTVLLSDVSGHLISLKECLLKHKGKIVLVDLWASWCGPCRVELPVLEKLKERFPATQIEFITISLDKEAAIGNWINAMKEEALKGPNQYRLVDSSHSPLNKIFEITTVPRYIVFDRKGRVLNETFLRPSDPQFESKLLSYLSSRQIAL